MSSTAPSMVGSRPDAACTSGLACNSNLLRRYLPNAAKNFLPCMAATALEPSFMSRSCTEATPSGEVSNIAYQQSQQLACLGEKHNFNTNIPKTPQPPAAYAILL